MKTCCFFGHRDTPQEIKPKLINEIENLIINENVNEFYVGNHGGFDLMVANALHELKIKYPHIDYSVVLAYMPKEKVETFECKHPTLLPEGIESVPKRFAINFRNKWIIKNSTHAIVYINCTLGGAFKFYELAEKSGLKIIKL
ncbi:MAG: hypothetical protein R3Y27_08035 [Clostridia bacterium]